MRIVSTSYSKTPEYTDPQQWLERIDFYTGILESLAQRHEVMSIERISYEGEMARNNVLYHFIDLKKPVSRFPVKMHGVIKSWNPDVVLVNGFIFPMQIIQLRRTVGRKVKIIVLHRSEKPFRGLKKRLQQLADRCTDAYLFSSFELGRDWFRQGVIKHREKIHEVMPASSVFGTAQKIAPGPPMSVEGSPVFLWVGRLDENKDPVTVVKAFNRFKTINPQAILYMIFQSGHLQSQVAELIGDSANIKLVGKTEHKDLGKWYNNADFFISGSHYEGGGIAVNEALSCGCIPLVTDIPSFRVMTGRGKFGFLYRPGDDEALYQCLLKTINLNTEEERQRVIAHFDQELSFSAIAGKIEKVIHSIDRRNE